MFSYNIEKGEMFIYDEIGPAYWGLIDAATVIDALAKFEGKDVTVRLNTPGGSVDEGIAIFNALKRHKGTVTTAVDSMAASMGSYLLQAGERRLIAANAMVMIHDPWSISIGNSSVFRKDADILDKYADRMVPEYAAKSGKTEEEVKAIMAEESWYTGKEAIDAGWADELMDENDVEPVTKGLARVAFKAPAALFAKRDKAIESSHQLGGFPRRKMAMALAKQIAEVK